MKAPTLPQQSIELIALRPDSLPSFKKDMQEAFQKGFTDRFGKTTDEILPESHIDKSLSSQGAQAYEAIEEGVRVGGAIVVIDETTQHNHLDFLYVKAGTQSKGVGGAIWNEIERIHSSTKIWETCTPYFDTRNIHFYLNKCRFHAVEFFNQHHPDPHDAPICEEEPQQEGLDGMLRFEKVMVHCA